MCNNPRGMIRKYGLDMCRRCFREYAAENGYGDEQAALEEGMAAKSAEFKDAGGEVYLPGK